MAVVMNKADLFVRQGFVAAVLLLGSFGWLGSGHDLGRLDMAGQGCTKDESMPLWDPWDTQWTAYR
jgi:hypothetical protein